MLNFNPYFKPPDEDGVPFISKTYASDIVNVVYPEDILASEIEKSSDVSGWYLYNYSLQTNSNSISISFEVQL